MITYIKASEEHIEELAELRSAFLMESNELANPEAKLEFKRSNLAYFREALPCGEFNAWIAVENGRIAATSGIVFFSIAPNKTVPNGLVGYIQNMYTIKEYRRQGIAKKLFEKMIEEAKYRGCRKVMLNASSDGRPLYEQFGFKDMVNEMESLLD